MKKGEILEDIAVETIAAEGKCIGKIDGRIIFMEGGAPGDIVDIQLYKIKSNYLEGKVTKIKKLSENRATPFCSHFGLCGGCTWQHLQYTDQLFFKQKQVIDNLERLGGLSLPSILPIHPSQKIKNYRNRLDFTFSSQRWLTREEIESRGIFSEPALGFHIPKKFDKVFDVVECHLQNEPSNSIRLAVRDEALKASIPFFDLRNQTGFLRTLTIRTAITGDTMVILQITSENMEWIERILNRLKKDFKQITSFNYIINNKKNDSFSDLDVICWRGNPFITEVMPTADGRSSLQFRVGPKSFYQTNSQQAYDLYKIAWQFAALKGDELVYDLYTGTGTIANFIARHAKKVIGLEYVTAAIEDAKINSSINNIDNTDFYAGDIKDLLDEEFLSKHGKPDVVITDPPRAGMHEDVCKMLLNATPAKIIYVSCNAATQARDLKILSEKYQIEAVQPVDMFPHTMHVENVVSIRKRN